VISWFFRRTSARSSSVRRTGCFDVVKVVLLAQPTTKLHRKANKLTKAEKETALKYSNKAVARTEKALAELADDTDAEQSELDATLEYLAKVNKRCVAKPETYASRKAKRESEIEGLKNALKILEEETAGAFLAVRTVSRHQ